MSCYQFSYQRWVPQLISCSVMYIVDNISEETAKKIVRLPQNVTPTKDGTQQRSKGIKLKEHI